MVRGQCRLSRNSFGGDKTLTPSLVGTTTQKNRAFPPFLENGGVGMDYKQQTFLSILSPTVRPAVYRGLIRNPEEEERR